MAELSIFVTEPGKAKNIIIEVKDAREIREKLKPGDFLTLRENHGVIEVYLPNGKKVGRIEGETASQIANHLKEIKAHYIIARRNSMRILLKSEKRLFPEETAHKIAPFMAKDFLEEEELELEPNE